MNSSGGSLLVMVLRNLSTFEIDPSIRIWLVDCDDPGNYPRWVAALYMERSFRQRVAIDQATGTMLVVRIALNGFAVVNGLLQVAHRPLPASPAKVVREAKRVSRKHTDEPSPHTCQTSPRMVITFSN